jgi:hypothetical protein
LQVVASASATSVITAVKLNASITTPTVGSLSLDTQINMLGSGQTVSTATPALTALIRLVSPLQVATIASASTLLTSIKLNGALSLSVTPTPALSAQIRMVGSLLTVASASSNLNTFINLLTAALSVSNGSNSNLSTQIRLNGTLIALTSLITADAFGLHSKALSQVLASGSIFSVPVSSRHKIKSGTSDRYIIK